MKPFLVVLAWLLIWVVPGYMFFGRSGGQASLLIAVLLGVAVPMVMPMRWLRWINGT